MGVVGLRGYSTTGGVKVRGQVIGLNCTVCGRNVIDLCLSCNEPACTVCGWHQAQANYFIGKMMEVRRRFARLVTAEALTKMRS